jgi:N utilization substance protein B
MLSRRNIRVKVMQTLYTLASGGETDEANRLRAGKKALSTRIEHSLDLFSTILLVFVRVAQYSEVDSTRRRSKRLPTPEDLNVPTKIAGNLVIWSILENATFQQRIKDKGLDGPITDDFLRNAYKALQGMPEYAAYNEVEGRTQKEERAMLRAIWEQLIIGTEWGQDFLTTELSGWEDDADMIGLLVENFLKKPQKANFLQLLSEEKRRWALDMIEYVIEKQSYLDELIKPKLQNWDAERVAQIDNILLRMGVAEILYFPSIPTKVTINEYIDIAKMYSTSQSGHFVNGVLDNVLKTLVAEDRVHKEERIKKA